MNLEPKSDRNLDEILDVCIKQERWGVVKDILKDENLLKKTYDKYDYYKDQLINYETRVDKNANK